MQVTALVGAVQVIPPSWTLIQFPTTADLTHISHTHLSKLHLHSASWLHNGHTLSALRFTYNSPTLSTPTSIGLAAFCNRHHTFPPTYTCPFIQVHSVKGKYGPIV